MNDKRKVCRFKENCPQWLAKKDCGFDHVLCKFNQTCKDKQKCMFYHKEKPVFDKPKSETLCKFNKNCTKPGCPFKHEKKEQDQKVQGFNQNQDKKPFQGGPSTIKICKFKQQCQRPDCKFGHPQRQGKGQPNLITPPANRQQSQPRRQLSQPQPQTQPVSSAGFFQSQQRRTENKFCLDFLLTNNCQNGQNCQKLHEFTEKASFKRVFFSTQVSNQDFNILSYEHTKQNDPQSKQLIYVVQQKQRLTFRKLISSENLYKDYGGIGSNRENKTYLRSITDQVFKANSVINGIEAFTFNTNQYLTFVSGSNIFIYNTTRGQIDQFQTSKMGNKLTGCVIIPQSNLLLISTSQTGIKKFLFNQSTQKFEQKQFNEVQFGIKVLKCTQNQILGEKVIYGVTKQNKILLMNSELRHQLLTVPNASNIHDIQITLVNNKIPAALVSCTMGSRQHQVFAINLLNFDKQPLLQYQFTSGIGKICVIEGQLMIQVKNKGFLIYKMNEFQKQIGILPMNNEVQQVRKDNKGNLLILESSSVQSKGSISIFKVKRV